MKSKLNRIVSVLSVGPVNSDSVSLACIFTDSDWTPYTSSKWALIESSTIGSAVASLRENRPPIVLCEADLDPGTWQVMLGEIIRLPEPPFLIVTSRLADERLWAEVVNLGAYDVLAKPFESKEVVRIVSLAWLHWKDRYELPINPQTLMAAAT